MVSMLDIQLYIYDLSNGLAKQISLGLLGDQIEAIYHTSIVIEGLEYVYDGGIKVVPAGKTHLGPPMKTVNLGVTELPIDVILEYLESMKKVYTHEAYDVWTHNCNDFSNDFATFLVGHGIPSYISNLPQTVLNSPFGNMIKPYIDQFVSRAQSDKGALLGIENGKTSESNEHAFVVNVATSMSELDGYLQIAERSSAIVFFTSQYCGPCKALYNLYNKMAENSEGKVIFIKVDISRTREVGIKYSIMATPTFITFHRGKQEKKWTGSDPTTLKCNFNILQQLAGPCLPSHRHDSLPLPLLRSEDTGLVYFTKVPPVSKLKTKLGPLAEKSIIIEILKFITSKDPEESAKKKIPDLDALSKFILSGLSNFSPTVLFVIVDIFRVAVIDPDIDRYYAEEKDQKTVRSILSYVNSLKDCPYPLRLVTLHLCCNLFKNQPYQSHIFRFFLSELVIQLLTSSLLDEQNCNVQVAASALIFNMATVNQRSRSEKGQDLLSGLQQLELAALILQAITVETSSLEVLKGFLFSLGNLAFRAPMNGELFDLLRSIDARKTIMSKQKIFPAEPLIEEIGEVLLGKGFE